MERAEKAKVSSVGYVVQCELVHFYKARENKKNVTPRLVWKCQEVELRELMTVIQLINLGSTMFFSSHSGIVHIPGDVQKNWSTKTLYHGLCARSILPHTTYFAILAMLHVVDPETEDPQNKLVR